VPATAAARADRLPWDHPLQRADFTSARRALQTLRRALADRAAIKRSKGAWAVRCFSSRNAPTTHLSELGRQPSSPIWNRSIAAPRTPSTLRRRNSCRLQRRRAASADVHHRADPSLDLISAVRTRHSRHRAADPRRCCHRRCRSASTGESMLRSRGCRAFGAERTLASNAALSRAVPRSSSSALAPPRRAECESASRTLDGEHYLWSHQLPNSPYRGRTIFDAQGVNRATVYQSERDDWILAMAAAGLDVHARAVRRIIPGVVRPPADRAKIWREVASSQYADGRTRPASAR